MLTWYFCIISFVMITVICLTWYFCNISFVTMAVIYLKASAFTASKFSFNCQDVYIASYFCLYDFHSVYFFITHSYYSYTSQPFIWQRHLALIVFLWWFWGSVNLNFHTYYLNSSLRVGKNLVSQTEGLTCSSSIKKVEQQSMTKNYHAVSPLSCG